MKRNKNGITLIALIITIVVMLILVGVTINLSANGDLFVKARTASKDTEQRKILEELISMAEFDNDGKIQVNSLVNKVKANYESADYDKTTSKLTVKGNKGEFYYKVTDMEIKIWVEPQDITGEYIDIGQSVDKDKIIYKIDSEKIVNEDEEINAEYEYDSETQIITFTNTTKKNETSFYRMKMHFIKNDKGETINILALPLVEDADNENCSFLMLSKNEYTGLKNYMLSPASYNGGETILGISENGEYGTWTDGDGTYPYLYMDGTIYVSFGAGIVLEDGKSFKMYNTYYIRDEDV